MFSLWDQHFYFIKATTKACALGGYQYSILDLTHDFNWINDFSNQTAASGYEFENQSYYRKSRSVRWILEEALFTCLVSENLQQIS